MTATYSICVVSVRRIRLVVLSIINLQMVPIQACSLEFAQGGSDFIETQESTPTFVFFVYSLKSEKEGGKICQN